ncbi:hypothetical protein MSAN_00462700 [Mycena sanguinolenta]|uniref:Transmembrane protein n=1 Tax=Mycena sanguinolenta TaxID=230812 RepID=A0A8H7DJL9_9AGAR|nr:hypothetical protein MSAN_00462700 [Mycena sanguinolenta]
MADTAVQAPTTVEINDAMFCTHLKEVVRVLPFALLLFFSLCLLPLSWIFPAQLVSCAMLRHHAASPASLRLWIETARSRRGETRAEERRTCTDCDFDGREENDAFFGFDPIDRERASRRRLWARTRTACISVRSMAALVSVVVPSCMLHIFRSRHRIWCWALRLPVWALRLPVLAIRRWAVDSGCGPSSCSWLLASFFLLRCPPRSFHNVTRRANPPHTACNQCFGWKKQITRARAAAKKAGKK